MADPQFIRTPKGEELVVLTRADYDELVAAAEFDEDAADAALYDERKGDLAAGRDEVLPGPINDGLLHGESRIKAIRKWRGLSQTELAERAGIGQSYLSELETRHKQGAADTLLSLAKALDVPANWLGEQLPD